MDDIKNAKKIFGQADLFSHLIYINSLMLILFHSLFIQKCPFTIFIVGEYYCMISLLRRLRNIFTRHNGSGF